MPVDDFASLNREKRPYDIVQHRRCDVPDVTKVNKSSHDKQIWNNGLRRTVSTGTDA